MTTAVYEIPLSPRPLTMRIALAGVTYALRFHYCDAEDAGWILDIADDAGNPLVCGIPLITGADLLAQYKYLGIGGRLFLQSDAPDRGAVPTYDGLGVSSHLYFVPN